ncbi:MAG: TlpA family protein disulfide reductase [Gemmataceae bacterium]|nr:TlpA family protein disulfide reductase [Gemmataceae bacterium]MCI0737945.1 TlpA family protein disulfide reductase [Gemmataceae bacterium]
MKVGANVFALGLLIPIATWGLSGCTNKESATTTKTDTRDKGADSGDEHAKHAEAKTAGDNGEEHGKHDHHHKDGHKRGEHKDHKHGEHHDKATALQGSVKVGDNVPDFSVRTLDGKSAKLSELQKDERRTEKGIVVLSFWCTTCHSCRDVEHLVAKLYKDYRGRVAVIALDANADETAERVAAFVKKNGLELSVVLDRSGITADLFGVQRTTTTVVIDGNGVLRYCGQFRQKGGGSAEEALKAVLAGNEVAIKTTPHHG